MPRRAHLSDDENDLEGLRRQYLDHLDVLESAAQHVRDVMDAAAGTLDVIRVHLRDGGNISDFGGVINPIPIRNDLGTALVELERARHRAQQLIFRILVAEGKSATDIARVWGISRQLVSRLLNEPL